MSNNNNNFLTIGDLVRLCLRRWKWFALSVGICLLGAGVHLYRTPKTYTSKATVLVKEESLGENAAKTAEDFSDLGLVTPKSNVPNVVHQILSLDVLMEVAHRLDPEADNATILARAQEYGSRLHAERDSDKSTIINLAYKDVSPEKANEMLTMIIDVYDDKFIEDKYQLTKSTSDFIDNRLSLLEQDLDRVDDSISTYKSRYGITDLTSVSDVYLQRQSQSDAQLLTLSNQKAMALFIKEMVDDTSGELRPLLVNSGIENPTIESQITQYNTLLMQLNSHLTYTSEQNPIIVNLQQEIESLRKSIKRAIEHHIQSLDIQLAAVQGYNSDATSKISSNPKQAKYLASIEREQKVKESLYLYLLQKKEENEISVTYRSSAIRVLDIPHASNAPTAPRIPRVVLAALLLGLVLPLFFIFIRVTLDDRVRTVADIQHSCDLPVLGDVPGVGRRKKKRSVVVTQAGRSWYNDAFRMIRTRLELSATPEEKVFLVTAEGPGAGKTFVSMNLTMAFAFAGKKVLLIDGDLRRAKTSKLWEARGLGLSDFLQGKVEDWQSLIVRHDDNPGMDVLPAGTLPDDPAALLMSPRLAELFSELRSAYDLILIDSPSSTLIVDGEIFLRQADSIIFVLRAGRSDRRKVGNIKESLSAGDKRIFIVLNAADSDDSRYY